MIGVELLDVSHNQLTMLPGEMNSLSKLRFVCLPTIDLVPS